MTIRDNSINILLRTSASLHGSRFARNIGITSSSTSTTAEPDSYNEFRQLTLQSQ